MHLSHTERNREKHFRRAGDGDANGLKPFGIAFRVRVRYTIRALRDDHSTNGC
jgi:hypothetical protein